MEEEEPRNPLPRMSSNGQLSSSNRLASSFNRTPDESLQHLKYRMSDQGNHILVGVCAMGKKVRLTKIMKTVLLTNFTFSQGQSICWKYWSG